MTGNVRFFINLAVQNRGMVGLKEGERKLAIELFAARKARMKDLTRQFKDNMERDSTIARADFRAESFSGTWRFAEKRKEIQGQITSLAVIFRDGLPLPEDFDIRIARLSVALYLLEKVQEMRDAAMRMKNTTVVALFDMVRRKVEGILDQNYFSKSKDQIIREFFDAELELTACAKCCNIQVLEIWDVSEKYKMKVATLVDEEVKNSSRIH